MTSTWILSWNHCIFTIQRGMLFSLRNPSWYEILLKNAQKCFRMLWKHFFLKSTYPNWLGSSLVLSSLNQNRHFSWGVTTFIFLSLSILDSSVVSLLGSWKTHHKWPFSSQVEALKRKTASDKSFWSQKLFFHQNW